MQTSMDLSRYSRQILFQPIGEAGQRKLLESTVSIVGLGALGTVLANHMVRAGVGTVRLIDRDFVEPSNLQRQMLYDEADARQALPKAEAAKRRLQAVNSEIQIQAHVTDLNWKNAVSLLEGSDLILDGSDNFQVRFLLNDVSIKLGIPWIYGGGVSADGITATFRPGHTPCLRCLMPDPPLPGSLPTCDTTGVVGPVIDIVASLQAMEAFKVLTGAADALRGDLLQLSLWNHQIRSIGLSAAQDENCPCCRERKFDFLEPDQDQDTLSLCGRNTIQINPARGALDLDALAAQLKPIGEVELTRFYLRVMIDSIKMTIFPDGRALIQGTDDPSLAKSFYARYVGL